MEIIGNLHYQTCLHIKSNKIHGNVMEKVKRIIFSWLKNKEKYAPDLRENDAWDKFSYKCYFPQMLETRSEVKTETCKSDDFVAWAMRYSHKDSNRSSRRKWHVDIGLRDIGNEVIFYCGISYSKMRHELSPVSPPPNPSVPNFVKELINKNEDLIVSPDDTFKMPFSSKLFFIKNQKEIEILVSIIKNNERVVPVIVFNGSSSESVYEASDMAAKLTGKAQIFIIESNKELARVLENSLEYEYRIPHLHLKVFFPFCNDANSYTHRYYDIYDENYDENKNGIIFNLLSNYEVRPKNSIRSIEDIRREITLVKLKKLSNELAKGKKAEDITAEDIKEFEELISSYQEDWENEKRKLEGTIQQHESTERNLKDQVANLQSKVDVLQSLSDNGNEIREKANFVENLSRYPDSLNRVLNFFEKAHGRKMIFTESAIKSAREYDNFKDFDKAWDMLYAMATHLYNMKFEGSKNIDFEAVFKERSGYDLAMTEGRNTKRDTRLMNLRKVKHDGKVYDITKHVKFGNKGNKILRIHFDFDEELKKIIIGHVGPHLDNASTRSLS